MLLTESPEQLRLTARETQILSLIRHELTNEAIAHRLGISRRTVEEHLMHIYAKLGVRSRAAAVMRAFGPR